MKKIIASLLILAYSTASWSHGGATDNNGCHNDNTPGGYFHCHNDSADSGGDVGTAIGSIVGLVLLAWVVRGATAGAQQQVISAPPTSQQVVDQK